MAVLGGIGEVYLVSAGAGFTYMLISLLMGQMHGGGAAHGGGHVGGHIGAGGTGGHIGGHVGTGDATAGHGLTHAGASNHGSIDSTQPQAGAPSGTGHLAHLGHAHVHFPHGADGQADSQLGTDTRGVPVVSRRSSMFVRLLLTVLSPMTISMFLTFFGSIGMILYSVAPSLGWLTVVPAVMIAAWIARLLLSAMSYITEKMFVTSGHNEAELIGHMAKVKVGIEPGGMGQIIYVIGSKRFLCPARAISENMQFKHGTRVMIADIRDHVMYIEPWVDEFIPDQTDEIIDLEPKKIEEEQKKT